MPEVLHISCNIGTRALPDMSALALRCCAPSQHPRARAYISDNALVPVLQLLHISYVSPQRFYTS